MNRITGPFRAGGTLALLALSAVVVWQMPGCAAPPIRTEPPPPPPPRESAPQEYRYRHEQPTPPPPAPRPFGQRKPVVALLRAGDLVDFAENLPFGRRRLVVVPDQTRPQEFQIQGKVGDPQNPDAVDITGRIDSGKQPRTVELQGQPDAPVLLPVHIRQYLLDGLVNSGSLIVVERERILEILREQTFAASPRVDPNTAPQPGRLLGVHYIIEAAYYPPGSAPARESMWRELDELDYFGLGWQRGEGPALVYLSVYDVQTGVIVAVARGGDHNPELAVHTAVHDVIQKLARQTQPPIRLVSFDAEGRPVLDIGGLSGAAPGEVYRGPGDTQLRMLHVDALLSRAEMIRGNVASLAVGAVFERVQPG
ncbi:MAG: CsgG/HfaB family protein [Planctomycetota bacterium]